MRPIIGIKLCKISLLHSIKAYTPYFLPEIRITLLGYVKLAPFELREPLEPIFKKSVRIFSCKSTPVKQF